MTRVLCKDPVLTKEVLDIFLYDSPAKTNKKAVVFIPTCHADAGTRVLYIGNSLLTLQCMQCHCEFARLLVGSLSLFAK